MTSNHRGWWVLFVAMLITGAIYSTGLSGAYIFDDYPNIVDNHAVQPTSASVSSLVGAALSSSSSEFKRPLASLSFATNFLVTGLDPYWMKLTNLVIHLLNGLLIFLLARLLLGSTALDAHGMRKSHLLELGEEASRTGHTPPSVELPIQKKNRASVVAALVASSWMLLPINLTGVLYVVQRMESMANLFVLVGLIGYVAARRHMHEAYGDLRTLRRSNMWADILNRHFLLCLVSITVPTALGLMAKETAVMLPLYALLVEWAVFRFAKASTASASALGEVLDCRVVAMFVLILLVPLVIGLGWLLPAILRPATWASRNFTLGTRLLSESRIVVDYIVWTLLPTPHALSFYHDDFRISKGLLSPASTLVSIGMLAALIALMFQMRTRRPMVALGLALFLGCHLLTGTIIPLELVYEHRNYFASFGLMLAVVPLLTAPGRQAQASVVNDTANALESPTGSLPLAIPRYVLLAGLMVCWAALTAITASAWSNPLKLAEDLAVRAPLSPRAEYELGRTYIIYSHYDPASPFTALAYAPLEKAAALPDSSILAEQALIFMNARMNRPLKDAWWESMITKLKRRKTTVQDESSLASLTRCANEHSCDLPRRYMVRAFTAALSHPNPSARLFATYSDYAWNVLQDHALGLRMIQYAVKAEPHEPAYQITLIRMLAAEKQIKQAHTALKTLEKLNYGGELNESLKDLRARLGMN